MEIRPSQHTLFKTIYNNCGNVDGNLHIALEDGGRYPLTHRFVSGDPIKDEGKTVYKPRAKMSVTAAQMANALGFNTSGTNSTLAPDSQLVPELPASSDNDMNVRVSAKALGNTVTPTDVNFWAVFIPSSHITPAQLAVRFGLEHVRALGSPAANIHLFQEKKPFDPNNPFQAGRMPCGEQLRDATAFRSGRIVGKKVKLNDIRRLDTVYAYKSTQHYRSNHDVEFTDKHVAVSEPGSTKKLQKKTREVKKPPPPLPRLDKWRASMGSNSSPRSRAVEVMLGITKDLVPMRALSESRSLTEGLDNDHQLSAVSISFDVSEGEITFD